MGEPKSVPSPQAACDTLSTVEASKIYVNDLCK